MISLLGVSIEWLTEQHFVSLQLGLHFFRAKLQKAPSNHLTEKVSFPT